MNQRRSHRREFGEEVDAVIANIQATLDATDGLLALAPVPGLSPAIQLIKSLLNGVKVRYTCRISAFLSTEVRPGYEGQRVWKAGGNSKCRSTRRTS